VNGNARPVKVKVHSTSSKALASGIYHTGLLAALQRVALNWELRSTAGGLRWPRTAEPRYVILCYHRVGVEGVPLYSRLEPLVFEAQMRHLRRHYRVLSLADMLSEIERPTSSVPTVAVTFDDGYRDVFDHAFPVLRKYEIPATVFAVTEAIETGSAPWYDRIFLALATYPESALTIELDALTEFSLQSFDARLAATDCIVRWLREQTDCRRREFCADFKRRLPIPEQRLQGRMLTWEQLRIMQDHGVVCGSHTITHPVLSRLDRESLLRELRDSRLLLEKHLGRPVTDFAFPFGKPGDCTGVTDADLASCGYCSAATAVPGTNRSGVNPYTLHRVSLGEQPHLALFAYQLNDLFLRAEDPGGPTPVQETSRILPERAVAPREGR
jgi:peptidoglycan/xylan/chitin deacetylase (PgdA/CDA1 family)